MKQKLKLALIQQALLRWENAVLIALAILLTAFLPQPFAFWPVWGWGVLALGGVIAITLSGLRETGVQEAAIEGMLYQEYNPSLIRTKAIRTSFLQGLGYRRTIEQMIADTSEGVIRTRLNDLSDKVNQWTSYIYQLARVLDDYQCDPMLRKDPAAIQAELSRIQADMARQTDPGVIEESKNLVASKQNTCKLRRRSRIRWTPPLCSWSRAWTPWRRFTPSSSCWRRATWKASILRPSTTISTSRSAAWGT